MHYKKYSNKLNSLIKTAECNYYQNKLTIHAEDSKTIWKTLNSMLKNNKNNFTNSFEHNSKTIADQKEIVENFNDLFVNMGPELARKIPPIQNSEETKQCRHLLVSQKL